MKNILILMVISGLSLSPAIAQISHEYKDLISKIEKNAKESEILLKKKIIQEKNDQIKNITRLISSQTLSSDSIVDLKMKFYFIEKVEAIKGHKNFDKEDFDIFAAFDEIFMHTDKLPDFVNHKSILQLERRLDVMQINDKIQTFKADNNMIDTLRILIAELQKADKEINKYQGEISTNYNSNFAQNTFPNTKNSLNTYGINTAVNKDIYPREFNFNATLLMNEENGSFRDQISNVFISYDHNINKVGNKPIELYGFFQRSSNSFLGVESRYITGLGMTLDCVSSIKRLHSKGTKQISKIDTLYNYFNNHLSKANKCLKNLCESSDIIKVLDKSDSTSLIKYVAKSKAMIQEKYRRHRFGFLAGFVLEFEQNEWKDSINVRDKSNELIIVDKIENNLRFQSTSDLRFQFRLHYVSQITDEISFYLKPYVFIPLELNRKVVNDLGKEEKIWDGRFQLDAGFNFRYQNVDFNLTLQYNYDNLPGRSTYSYNNLTRGFLLPKEHVLISGKFIYKLQ